MKTTIKKILNQLRYYDNADCIRAFAVYSANPSGVTDAYIRSCKDVNKDIDERLGDVVARVMDIRSSCGKTRICSELTDAMLPVNDDDILDLIPSVFIGMYIFDHPETWGYPVFRHRIELSKSSNCDTYACMQVADGESVVYVPQKVECMPPYGQIEKFLRMQLALVAAGKEAEAAREAAEDHVFLEAIANAAIELKKSKGEQGDERVQELSERIKELEDENTALYEDLNSIRQRLAIAEDKLSVYKTTISNEEFEIQEEIHEEKVKNVNISGKTIIIAGCKDRESVYPFPYIDAWATTDILNGLLKADYVVIPVSHIKHQHYYKIKRYCQRKSIPIIHTTGKGYDSILTDVKNAIGKKEGLL